MRLHELLNEVGGVGKVVKGINTTPDVGIGAIKKQAAKFGNSVTPNGQPPTVNPNGSNVFRKQKRKKSSF